MLPNKYTKKHFRLFYRDMRIYYGTSKSMQNFHISYAESWDYVVKAYSDRNKQDALLETETKKKIFWFRLFKGLSVNLPI